MIVLGYYGGTLILTGDELTPCQICWFFSMCFFLYIVYQLLVGLSNATNQEASDPVSKGKNKDKDKDKDELVTNSLLSLHCLPASRRPFKCTLDATTLDVQKEQFRDAGRAEGAIRDATRTRT